MRKTRSFKVGSVQVGGGAPVSVQSMTKTDTRDVDATLAQIAELADAGCDMVRVAVPDRKAVRLFPGIVSASVLPVIADVHFDYRLALAAIEAGSGGIRINPGNVGGPDRVTEIARAAAANDVPVRVGVNAGSLAPEICERHGGRTAEAMVASALQYCDMLEADGCRNIKVSLKAADVVTTVHACREFAARTDYPLHLGVTEAGTMLAGTVKSAIGIGALLLEGIGDTLRVSLTAPPLEEVRVGIKILQALGLRHAGPEVISCPTCGRTRIDLMSIVKAVELELQRLRAQGREVQLAKIAVMGCAVNGPGEAGEADLGVAGGDGRGLLFKKGEVIRRLPESELLPALLEEIRRNAAPASQGNAAIRQSGRNLATAAPADVS